MEILDEIKLRYGRGKGGGVLSAVNIFQSTAIYLVVQDQKFTILTSQ